MKKTLLMLFSSGLLLAQTNVLTGNNIDTKGGDVTISQSNSQISEEEIKINRKIDEETFRLMSSLMDMQSKNMIATLLHQSKTINQQQIPLAEKNRECKFKADLNAKVLKYANVKLSLSYCDKIF